MKANRKFVEGEEAVSAVIGVILMVAITVAIAAAVYVYVSGMLAGTTQHTPTIACIVDNDADKIIINSAEPGIDWYDIKLTSTASKVYVNSSAGANIGKNTGGGNLDHCASSANQYEVTAGDYIQVVGSGEVEVTLTYIPTNTLLGTWTVNV